MIARRGGLVGPSESVTSMPTAEPRPRVTIDADQRWRRQQLRRILAGYPAVFQQAAELPQVAVRYLVANDGARLAYRVFAGDPSQPPAAHVLIYGGFALANLVARLLAHHLATQHGLQCWHMDVRGDGMSGGPPGDAPSRDAVLRDVRSLIRFIKWNHPGQPVVLGATSFGAALVRRRAAMCAGRRRGVRGRLSGQAACRC